LEGSWPHYLSNQRETEETQVAKKDIAIVGYHETKIDVNTGRSPFDFAGEVLDGLLDQTGLEKDAIDGFAVCSAMSGMSTPFWSVVVSDYLGMELNWCQQVDIGGSSPLGARPSATANARLSSCSAPIPNRRQTCPMRAAGSRSFRIRSG
jgi:hypothetical protein